MGIPIHKLKLKLTGRFSGLYIPVTLLLLSSTSCTIFSLHISLVWFHLSVFCPFILSGCLSISVLSSHLSVLNPLCLSACLSFPVLYSQLSYPITFLSVLHSLVPCAWNSVLQTESSSIYVRRNIPIDRFLPTHSSDIKKQLYQTVCLQVNLKSVVLKVKL